MSGRLPDNQLVQATALASRFDRGESLDKAIRSLSTPSSLARQVVLPEPGDVLVDVATTLDSPFTTGIQRVVRESVMRWIRDHGARPITWTTTLSCTRLLRPHEQELMEKGLAPDPTVRQPRGQQPALVVPWECTYILPEVVGEYSRSVLLQPLARYSRCRTGAVGYDVVAVTSAETRGGHDNEHFLEYLNALQPFDAITPISRASEAEFEGWHQALAGAGLTGPELREVTLPASIHPASEEAREEFAAVFDDSSGPVVLVVGSHEPRKNHLAVLHAAELLWRRGHVFTLCFLGARSWGGKEFRENVADLQAADRSLLMLGGVDDDILAAAYTHARFSVFPSLNEGFGLPVAESLALGTPVITSNFGSMAQIAEGGGALTVDPRDDYALSEAMEALLGDDLVLSTLEKEAAARPKRTWDDYARETWEVLTGRLA
ncbi:glycosyltransferase family 4 protein [Nocardioides gansuensis]|nr:glycosyltransferase family 1 protein [Nocardioides gansuensis]